MLVAGDTRQGRLRTSHLPLVAPNIAATSGQDAVVLCTIDAVWLGTEGGTEGVASPGLPVLTDICNEFISIGGPLWLCGVCTKPRGIGEDVVAKGSMIVGAAKLVEEVVAGARTDAFAEMSQVNSYCAEMALVGDETSAWLIDDRSRGPL